MDRDDLRAHETDLVGQWLDVGGRIEADAVADRIKHLVAHRLDRVGSADGGWSILFRDPRDGRYWELTYPRSATQGGGPPRLRYLTVGAAKAKYSIGTG